MARRQCSGVNRFGKPCGSPAVGQDGVCALHRLTPEQRLAQSARGGRAKGRNHVELPVPFELVEWIVSVIVSAVSGAHSASHAFDYLAPSLTTAEHERVELHRVLAPLDRPEAEEPLSRLEVARQHLLRLHAEGRLLDAELPPGVLQGVSGG